MLRKHWKLIVAVAVVAIYVGLISDALFPFRPQIPYSQLIVDERGEILHAFLSSDDKWRIKAELNEIMPELRNAIIQKEDRRFYFHPGFDPTAFARALFYNAYYGKIQSGGSTITMQVARLLNPKSRTVIHKLIEIFRAIQLELHYSKDEILQMYMNLVPYGGNIEGMKTASLLYFGKKTQYLSFAQIVTLSIIPNRPTSLALGKNNIAIQFERNRWIRRFAENNIVDWSTAEMALREPLAAQRMYFPNTASHFAYRMQSQFPDSLIIRSSIRRSVQERTQLLCYNYLQRQKNLGINNCAAIVIDNYTKKTLAYIGNPDANDWKHHGKVDGIRALRSPGSSLKPFIYGLCFDKGIITPKTVLSDVPMDFSGYAPENFDKRYSGTSTAEEALARSLNIPAAALLQKIGVHSLTGVLLRCGCKNFRRARSELGLSVALGGCAVSPEEMAGLYSALAGEGIWKPLTLLAEDNRTTDSFRIMSKASAYLTTQILSKLERPDMPNLDVTTAHIPKIAWKTGTSYGRRDAWSIGYNQRYTVLIWLGNFSNDGAPDLTGAHTATPLLFEIFNALDFNSPNILHERPKEIDFRIVCAESGLPPAAICNHTVIDYYLPGISANSRCNHKKLYRVSEDMSVSYCASCSPEYGVKKVWFDNNPPEFLAYCLQMGIPNNTPPPHNSDCKKILSENPPIIVSPRAGTTYVLEKNERQNLFLTARAGNDAATLYWYVNDVFYQSAAIGEDIYFEPDKPGKYTITCADDRGRNSKATIAVRYYR